MRHRLMTVLGAAALLLALAPAARAHAELEFSDPASGADVDDPPVEVVLSFDGELDPSSGFVVTDADGAEVGTGTLDLEVAERNLLRGPVEISEPGVYTVSWTAVSSDGHPEEGAFRFGYLAQVTGNLDNGHEGSAPNTALRAEPASPLTPIGLWLVALAVTLGARRIAASRSRP